MMRAERTSAPSTNSTINPAIDPSNHPAIHPAIDRSSLVGAARSTRRQVVATLLLAVCGSALAIDAPPPPAPPPNGVSIGWMVFVPATLTVAPGTTVTWTNWDDSNHGVKFADQKSGRLDKGATYTRTFTAPGEYPYICVFHGERMKGTVIVK